MTTEPKLALDGLTLIPDCTPVPVIAATALIPSLLVTVTPPATAPLLVGENLTVTGTLCEGAIVTGTETPLTETPVPLAVT